MRVPAKQAHRRLYGGGANVPCEPGCAILDKRNYDTP